jgi:hypothetical protein
MTGEKPKQQSRPRYWGFDSDSRGKSEEESGKFRVDADVENNRLLLWANPMELEEVRNLLVKLGEISSEGGNRETVRVLDLPAGKDGDEVVERIRRHWPSMGPNPLVVPPQPEPPPKTAPPSAPREKSPTVPAAKSTPSKTVSFIQSAELVSAEPAQASPKSAAAASEPAKPAPPAAGPPQSAAAPAKSPKPPAPAESPPPITFARAPDGHWIVSSPDTQALDRLEELAARMSAAARVDYQVFQLKYAWATSVASILEDVFKDDKDSGRRRTPWWYEMEYGSQDTEKAPTRLSKRKPLRIVADSDSNSILVQGGDAGQLKKIDDLIKIYDRAQPVDAKSARKTETVQLQYSKAKAVADTVKDVYRDLLSSTDKALAGNQEQRRERFIRLSFDDDSERSQKQPTYKGLLSIGTDEISNTLILSAPAYLLEEVVKMVKELDESARPVADSVSVVKVGPGMSAEKVEEAVNRVFGDGSAAGASREQKKGQATPPAGPQNDRNRRRQGRSHNQNGHGGENH